MSQASEHQLLSTQRREPHVTPYPAPPWHAHGRAWLGIFRADRPTTLPAGMTPLLGERTRVVGLVRYLPGSTLAYDEFFAAVPVRGAGYFGLYVDAMYVNDLPSLWGGRRIWGLPKELARFTWQGDQCIVADAGGPIATLRVDRHISWLPALPALVPTIGVRDGQVLVLPARLRARLGRAGLRVESWGPRFTYRLPNSPVFALGCKPFTATFPAPRVVSPSASQASAPTPPATAAQEEIGGASGTAPAPPSTSEGKAP